MSTLRTNALEGVDAKNSITIVAGAGNITTTNVQQGLVVTYLNLDGTGTVASNKSVNIASITDAGNGDYRPVFTNNFADVNFVCLCTHQHTVSNSKCDAMYSQADSSTGGCRVMSWENDSATDVDCFCMGRAGDLA